MFFAGGQAALIQPRQADRACKGVEGVHLPRKCCPGSCLLHRCLMHTEAVHKSALRVLVQVHSIANTQLRLQADCSHSTSHRHSLTPPQQVSA